MNTLKIYVIEKEHFFIKDVVVMGKALEEYTRENLPTAITINNLSEIDKNDTEFVAVIFNDCPLCDMEFLEDKVKEMRHLKIKKYKIGDGFIENTTIDNDISLKVSEIRALKIESHKDLSTLHVYLKKRTMEKLLMQNIFIMDPDSTYIEPDVIIGEESTIYPMVTLRGKTVIGKKVRVFPYSYLESTVIEDNCEVHSTFAVEAKVGSNCTLGPFATLRKGSVIGDNCRVGDYVEIKNSTLEDNVKVAHLAYIGDSFVGSNTNVGCGTVFANYDGKVKRSVFVGRDVFIGANSNLVAPLSIGDNAFIAAGSTVTKDIPSNSFCIARSRETVKTDYRLKNPMLNQ